MKITKNDIGKTVYLVPSGNCVNKERDAGGVFNQVVTGVVTEMARSRGEIVITRKGGGYQTSFRLHPHDQDQIQTMVNGGYRVFTSQDEIRDYRIGKKVESYLNSARNIPTDKLLQIAELLGLEFEI